MLDFICMVFAELLSTEYERRIQNDNLCLRRESNQRPLVFQHGLLTTRLSGLLTTSKIEKVPRGFRGEKSSKDMASSRNLVSTIGALASPKWGTEPGVRKGKRSLLASHTRCICSMETTHNSVKVKLGIKVMKLVESLIGREVNVGQGSEFHLTFVRGLLHIAQQDPRIDHKTLKQVNKTFTVLISATILQEFSVVCKGIYRNKNKSVTLSFHKCLGTCPLSSGRKREKLQCYFKRLFTLTFLPAGWILRYIVIYLVFYHLPENLWVYLR